MSSSTFRALFIGDPHATASELEDCKNLIGLVARTAVSHRVDAIVFLGDQYHNHALVHLEVMNFWRQAFAALKRPSWEEIALVGNHDRPGVEGSDAHAMMAHDDILVVDKPMTYRGIRWVPYMASVDAFLAACQEDPVSPTLICHQTFDGSRYDNGFYASDGVTLDLVPQARVLSGHIHCPQDLGKLSYVGAPRWRTVSDANTERSIWVVDFQEGAVCNVVKVSTGDVCRRIFTCTDTELAPIDIGQYDPIKDDVRVLVSGEPSFVDERKVVLAAAGFKVKTSKTRAATAVVRESEGIDKAFVRYLEAFSPQFGTSAAKLRSLVEARLT